jgi:hypothetical protein
MKIQFTFIKFGLQIYQKWKKKEYKYILHIMYWEFEFDLIWFTNL